MLEKFNFYLLFDTHCADEYDYEEGDKLRNVTDLMCWWRANREQISNESGQRQLLIWLEGGAPASDV